MSEQPPSFSEKISMVLSKLGLKKLPDEGQMTSAEYTETPTETEGTKPTSSIFDMLDVNTQASEDKSSSILRSLVGVTGSIGDFHFPADVIGGSCPRVVGEEEDVVWNAAAEACDSERIHVVWQSTETMIWYLAVRSSELASYANSWCPFASCLPGMKDALPAPVCYTYFSEESATMMAISPESLNIYRGTSLVIRAKAERIARELGDAPIIELVPDRIVQLTPVPWYSMSLFEERARRVLATLAVVASLGLTGICFLIWLLFSLVLISTRHKLTDTQHETEQRTMDLMKSVEELRGSPMRDQLATFADLNDGLLAINGYLEVYNIEGGIVRWRAVVPNNVTADRIVELGGHRPETQGRNIEATPLGMAIGNKAEINYEQSQAGRK